MIYFNGSNFIAKKFFVIYIILNMCVCVCMKYGDSTSDKMKNRVLKLITFSVTITLGYNVD